jgi:hypothetical protein
MKAGRVKKRTRSIEKRVKKSNQDPEQTQQLYGTLATRRQDHLASTKKKRV